MKICIIPARGGSKRIPRKNVKPFHGKPMIAYAVTAAHESNMFDKVVVSTDDEQIVNVALKYGAEVPFMRPAELADDHTPTVPVIAHAIQACESLGWEFLEVCCIYPGVPFLRGQDIFSAYTQMRDMGANYAFPVTSFPSPIQRAFRRLDDGSVKYFQPENAEKRTQDLESSYFDVGQFYWGKKDAWLDGRNIHLNATTIVIPEWRVVDIDTQADWERAELIYATFFSKKSVR